MVGFGFWWFSGFGWAVVCKFRLRCCGFNDLLLVVARFWDLGGGLGLVLVTGFVFVWLVALWVLVL